MKRLVFVTKSMLWSLLLYILFMLAFNWEDVSNKVRGVDPVSVVNTIPSGNTGTNPQSAPASISGHSGILNVLTDLLDVLAFATR